MFSGCDQQPRKEVKPEGDAHSSPHGNTEQAVSTVAGIAWTIPEGWNALPQRQMRVATYAIPAGPGDSEGGECAVFYFGQGQGGDLNGNIDRWIGQFENPGALHRSSRTVSNMAVTVVGVAGTYLSPGGPMMQSQGKKENYKLSGAIVDAPEGLVFFKCTGPAGTMKAAEGGFEALVSSIRKE